MIKFSHKEQTPNFDLKFKFDQNFYLRLFLNSLVKPLDKNQSNWTDLWLIANTRKIDIHENLKKSVLDNAKFLQL